MAEKLTARRGDLIIIQRSSLQGTRDGRGQTVHRFTAARVTSITRDGTVKAFQEHSSPIPYQVRHEPLSTRYHITPQEAINVAAALATAAANPWNTSGDHTGKPYYSLQEVQAAMKPHLLEATPQAEAAIDAA